MKFLLRILLGASLWQRQIPGAEDAMLVGSDGRSETWSADVPRRESADFADACEARGVEFDVQGAEKC